MLPKLRNLGPQSARMLARAGIANLAQLHELGAVRAYRKVVDSGAKPSLNLLWALEGALTDRPWQAIAKNDRLRLLMALEVPAKPCAASGAGSTRESRASAGLRRDEQRR